jgi:hypothetical protein
LRHVSAIRRNFDLRSFAPAGRKTRGRLSVAPPTRCRRKYLGCVDVDGSGSFVLLRYVHLPARNLRNICGFTAGLLFHENRAFAEAWRRQVGQFVLVFFLPMLFTYSGLRANVLGLPTVRDWEWCMIILSVACVGKILAVYFAARHAGLLHSDAISSGVLMNTRALMELIVLNVGYELGYIPQSVFTMKVLMAIASTFMTLPLIRVIYRRRGQLIPRVVEA